MRWRWILPLKQTSKEWQGGSYSVDTDYRTPFISWIDNLHSSWMESLFPTLFVLSVDSPKFVAMDDSVLRADSGCTNVCTRFWQMYSHTDRIVQAIVFHPSLYSLVDDMLVDCLQVYLLGNLFKSEGMLCFNGRTSTQLWLKRWLDLACESILY